MNETLPGMTPDEFRRMTENGATAWAGVDPADLRAGGVPLPAPAAQDLEGLAHQIYSAAQLAPGEGVTDAVDRIVALLGAAAQEPLTPDMFWDASDPERYGDDIEEIIADYGPGDTVKIDCAKRLPRIRVFVVGDEGDYEVLGGITAAAK